MAYCTHCGQQLTETANFCANCGSAATNNTSTQRKTTYDGELHKCPNCGNVLGAYEVICEACGHERRGAGVSGALREFTEALAQADDEEHMAYLISGYPIPNTKEDILDFLVLASTNISGKNSTSVFEAWVAKLEQSYKKALLVFNSSEDLEYARRIYAKTYWIIARERIVHFFKVCIDAIKNLFLSIKSRVLRVLLAILFINWIAVLLRYVAYLVPVVAVLLGVYYIVKKIKERRK